MTSKELIHRIELAEKDGKQIAVEPARGDEGLIVWGLDLDTPVERYWTYRVGLSVVVSVCDDGSDPELVRLLEGRFEDQVKALEGVVADRLHLSIEHIGEDIRSVELIEERFE